MQGITGQQHSSNEQENFGRSLEREYLEQGLYWGRIGSKPKDYTARIGMETYPLSGSEVETLRRLGILIPRFLEGCVDLARRSVSGEYPWLWQDLCFGRSDLQIAIWKRELERKDIVLAKRVRIDAIRTDKGLRINEFTLGATGSGYSGLIDLISRKFFTGKNFFEPIAKKYVEAIHDLLPNGGFVGILLTPWRELYGPEQFALTGLLNEFGKIFGLKFAFAFTYEAEAREGGVYLRGEKLDLIERVFKEYTEIDKLILNRLVGLAAKIEKQIIDAYFEGKVLLHPNLLTFLDYKELMAWLFDEELESEWRKYLTDDMFEELKNIFAYTIIFRPGSFVWKGKKYEESAMRDLESQIVKNMEFEFEGKRLMLFCNNGVQTNVWTGESLIDGLGNLDVIIDWLNKIECGSYTCPKQIADQITFFAKSDRLIMIEKESGRWKLKIVQVKNVLYSDIVLKLSGGDNQAAGGHGIAISRLMPRKIWSRHVSNFLKLAQVRTVVAQEYCEMAVDEMMVFDPVTKKVSKENVRTRICVWYWLDNDASNSSFGGNTVTCIPISDGYIVHGRSNSAMTACSF